MDLKLFYYKPRIDPVLKKSFSRIGVPEKVAFRPDPFQTEALDKLEKYDVLVTAPTGSGKTWIASQAIGRYIMSGSRVWYASPLKALSNSIYREFSSEFGRKSVGILTGERKENSDAPVIVGTTEILRNQLYDSMHKGEDLRADLVILDEAHYLSDPDRGVVWEEVLIYLPSRVRLLLLSATISNAEEICSWLEQNRGVKAVVVRSTERPVPLEMLFLFPDGLISPLSGKRGLASKVKKYMATQARPGKRRGGDKLRYGDIIDILEKFDLLPAIFFLKSRSDCDQAILTCHRSNRSREIKSLLNAELEKYLNKYPHLKNHRQMDILKESLAASHHAGQLPYWKLLIEGLMNKGYIDVIFSTSTVAAGVNFPARSVALVQSDRYNGYEFTDLSSTDFHQMIGRAGRRGKDKIGFALIIPGAHQDPQLIHNLKEANPEPLISRIHINFSMTLNLLLSHTPEDIKGLLEKSFADFQLRKNLKHFKKKWDDKTDALQWMLPQGRCDTRDPYEIKDNILMLRRIKKNARLSGKKILGEKMIPYLHPGRILHARGKGIYVLFNTYYDNGKLISEVHNVAKPIRFQKGRVKLRRMSIEKIRFLYDHKIDLSDNLSIDQIQGILEGIDTHTLAPLLIKDISGDAKDFGKTKIAGSLNDLPCRDCVHFKDCHGKKNRDLHGLLNAFSLFDQNIERSGEGLWVIFKRHLRFLKDTGFVEKDDKLTHDGIWASNLRLDQPLLIAEAIRSGGFNGLSPELMAGCMAPFVWDRDIDVEVRIGGPPELMEIEDALRGIVMNLEEIRRLKAERGFDNPPIMVWPSYALFLWARGISWEQLLFQIPVSEGDMTSMITRTADHLRQVVNLKRTHPELAQIAGEAIDQIMREPVFLE